MSQTVTAMILGNAAGAWALLGVPALLAIHFLQQRRHHVPVSTLFLLRHAAPDSRSGRRWDRLRASRSLLAQIAAVLLATWLLIEPRWPRPNSTQTVAVVLDSSASLAAFHDEAVAAVDELFGQRVGLAESTEWLVLTTDPRQPPVRTRDRSLAMKAVDAWKPARVTHELAPPIRLAVQAAGSDGEVVFVTDRKSRIPDGQPALGVGRSLDNVGFAGGADMLRDDSGARRWRALVQNHSASPQTRNWWIEVNGQKSAPQTLTLAPGALVELGGPPPEGATEWVVVLSTDAFAADDVLPVVFPAPKPLRAAVTAPGTAGDFFGKLLAGIDGVSVVPATAQPDLVVAMRPVAATGETSTVTAEAAPAPRAWIVVPIADRVELPVGVAPVTPVEDPATDGLTWNGWFGAGPDPSVVPATSATILLWQGNTPLAWRQPGAANSTELWLDCSWTRSNVARLPATVLLVRRFVERVQDEGHGHWAQNFDAGQRLPEITLTHVADAAGSKTALSSTAELAWRPARTGTGGETKRPVRLGLEVLRAPEQPGFFTLSAGDDVLGAAAQWADGQQGDFKEADTFSEGVKSRALAAESLTQPDPWRPLWLALFGTALFVAWWPPRVGGAGARSAGGADAAGFGGARARGGVA